MAVLMTLDAQFYKIENVIELLRDVCLCIIIVAILHIYWIYVVIILLI